MSKKRQPNIVFVLADNVGWGDFSCYGGSTPTARIVKPASKSIRFNIKLWLRYSEGADKPIVTPQIPMIFDLGSDPGERNNLFATKMDIGWMFELALPFIAKHEKSIARYPDIKPGEEFNG